MPNFQNGRYSPRVSGAGKQFLKQVQAMSLSEKIARGVMRLPHFRKLVREEFECTERQIDAALDAGVVDFSNDFREFLDKQRKEMTPPEGENLSECPRCLKNTVEMWCDGLDVGCGLSPGDYYCSECGWTSYDAPEEDNDECPRCHENSVEICDCPIDGPGQGAYCPECKWTHMDAPEEDQE